MTNNRTRRIFAALKMMTYENGDDVYAAVDQFGNEYPNSRSTDAVKVATLVIDLNKLADDFRPTPSKTYHWGAICVVLDRERFSVTYGVSRWFKTKSAAADYGPRNFRNFVIAEYRGE